MADYMRPEDIRRRRERLRHRRRREACRVEGICINCRIRPVREGKVQCALCVDRRRRDRAAARQRSDQVSPVG